MPEDTPFTVDWDDGGGPYRLENISIEYKYWSVHQRVTTQLNLSLDMMKAPGCRDADFKGKCLKVLFEKVARIEDQVIINHTRKVFRDRLKQKIKEHAKLLSLSKEDIKIAFDEYIVEEVMNS